MWQFGVKLDGEENLFCAPSGTLLYNLKDVRRALKEHRGINVRFRKICENPVAKEELAIIDIDSNQRIGCIFR
tara:strand:+ start:1367 stop:1585 length:219 start_codon:yes stop_codon:yes gene_type:complete